MEFLQLLLCSECVLKFLVIVLATFVHAVALDHVPRTQAQYFYMNALKINTKDFEHCAIILIGFSSGKGNHFGIPAVTLVYRDYKTFSKIVSVLYIKHWKEKTTCSLILLIFPSSAELAQKTKDVFALISSARANYGRQMYFVAISNSILTHDPFIARRIMEAQPLFQFILTNHTASYESMSPSQASVELFSPCAARVTFKFSPASPQDQACLNMALLNSLEKLLIGRACPVDWELNFEITFQRLEETQGRKPASLGEKVVDLIVLNLNYSLSGYGKGIHSFNSSVTFERFFEPIEATVYVATEVYPRPQPFAPYNFKYIADTYRFFTRRASYNFITCDGAKRFISFTLFLRPFQKEVWFTCLALCIISVVGGYKLIRWLKSEDEPFFLMLRIVLEQDTILSSKLERVRHVKKIMVSLLLLFLTLTNAYRGILTANMATPPPRTQLKNITESINKGFKLLVDLQKSPITDFSKWGRGGKLIVRRDDAILNLAHHDNFFANLFEYHKSIRHNENQKRKTLNEFYDSLDLLHIINFSAVPEMLKCNRTILIGENSILEGVQSHHPEMGDQLYLGTDEFMPHPVTWVIGSNMWDRGNYVYLRFQGVIQSGILDKLQQGNYTHRDTSREPRQRPSPITTKHNFFIAAFILTFSCVGISILFFTLEHFVKLRKGSSTKVYPFAQQH